MGSESISRFSILSVVCRSIGPSIRSIERLCEVVALTKVSFFKIRHSERSDQARTGLCRLCGVQISIFRFSQGRSRLLQADTQLSNQLRDPKKSQLMVARARVMYETIHSVCHVLHPLFPPNRTELATTGRGQLGQFRISSAERPFIKFLTAGAELLFLAQADPRLLTRRKKSSHTDIDIGRQD
jgi:hypothetical protein